MIVTITVNELIEKLKKFNPDGKAEVLTHFDDNDPEYFDRIYSITLEEDEDGKLIVVLHTTYR